MFYGVVFISQLRQTLSRSGWFFPSSVRNNENCNFNTTTHNECRKCYISEPNIKECFKFFMLLQLREIEWRSVRRDTRVLLETGSRARPGPGGLFPPFLPSCALSGSLPSALCPLPSGAGGAPDSATPRLRNKIHLADSAMKGVPT